eukprot:scaffold8571_cov118-Isochrysis_galbana.AAC.3
MIAALAPCGVDGRALAGTTSYENILMEDIRKKGIGERYGPWRRSACGGAQDARVACNGRACPPPSFWLQIGSCELRSKQFSILKWAARPSALGLALEGCGLAVPLDARC